MATLLLMFEGFRHKPYVKIDDHEIVVDASNRCRLSVSSGTNKIFLCEKKSLFRFYWWLPMLNLWRAFLLLKQQHQGHSLVFDGECVHALLRVECDENEETVIKFIRKEISWEKAEAGAGYTTLSILSQARVFLQRSVPSSQMRFRLKCNQAAPYCILTLLYSLALLFFGPQIFSTVGEWVAGIAASCFVLGLAGFEIYKAVKQKSFEEVSKISRIHVKMNMKN